MERNLVVLDAVRKQPIPDAATEQAVRAFLRHIEGRYPICEAILFGSRARGPHTAESDADLAVVLSGANEERSRISGEMAEVAFDVLLESGLLVQAVPLWEDEMRHPECFENPSLIANIVRDGVKL